MIEETGGYPCKIHQWNRKAVTAKKESLQEERRACFDGFWLTSTFAFFFLFIIIIIIFWWMSSKFSFSWVKLVLKGVEFLRHFFSIQTFICVKKNLFLTTYVEMSRKMLIEAFFNKRLDSYVTKCQFCCSVTTFDW